MALYIQRTWLTSTLHSTKETSYVSDIVKDVNVLTEGREFEDWLAWISGNSWELFQIIPHTTATWHLAGTWAGNQPRGGEHPYGVLCVFKERS